MREVILREDGRISGRGLRRDERWILGIRDERGDLEKI